MPFSNGFDPSSRIRRRLAFHDSSHGVGLLLRKRTGVLSMINDRDTGGAVHKLDLDAQLDLHGGQAPRDGRAKIPGPIVDIDVQINEP